MRNGTDLDDRRDTAIRTTFIASVLRLAEITNLKQADVDRTKQTITVRGKGDKLAHRDDRQQGVTGHRQVHQVALEGVALAPAGYDKLLAGPGARAP